MRVLGKIVEALHQQLLVTLRGKLPVGGYSPVENFFNIVCGLRREFNSWHCSVHRC